jgi:hypothetical protein
MRAKILLPFTILALGVTILLLETPEGLTQGGPPKGKGGFKFDPALIFDKYAQGKSFFVISEVRDSDRRAELTAYAKKAGITDDKITRERYLKFFEERDQIRATLGFDRMAKGKDYFLISEMWGRDTKEEVTLFAKNAGITDDKITRAQYMKFIEERDKIRAGLSFDKMAQGKTFFLISEVRDRDRKDEMTLFAKNAGIANDQITREHYLKFLDTREQIRDELRTMRQASVPNERIDRQFKGYDRNGDGFLNQEEIQSTMFFKKEWEKWDANKDAKINLDEWRVYSRIRDQQQLPLQKSPDPAKSAKAGGVDVITTDDSARPDNWRAGRLPEGLPSWFKEWDLNSDGQVALYEWRQKSTDPVGKFLAMDANDDGLLTPDEVMRFQRTSAGANGQKTASTKGK